MRVALLAVLLAALAGGGAYNYRRNLAEEDKVPRPYRSYATADLDALIEAYEQEIESLEGRYQAQRRSAGSVKDTAFIDDGIREYERVRRSSSRSRALGAEISKQGATLEELRREKQIRAGEEDKMALFLRRLLTV